MIDILGSSSGDRRRQLHLDQALRTVLTKATRGQRYPIDRAFRRIDGHSVTMVVELTVPCSWLVADFLLRELRLALADVNRSVTEDHRLRVRVAVDCGETLLDETNVSGSAVVRAA